MEDKLTNELNTSKSENSTPTSNDPNTPTLENPTVPTSDENTSSSDEYVRIDLKCRPDDCNDCHDVMCPVYLGYYDYFK